MGARWNGTGSESYEDGTGTIDESLNGNWASGSGSDPGASFKRKHPHHHFWEDHIQLCGLTLPAVARTRYLRSRRRGVKPVESFSWCGRFFTLWADRIGLMMHDGSVMTGDPPPSSIYCACSVSLRSPRSALPCKAARSSRQTHARRVPKVFSTRFRYRNPAAGSGL